MVKVASRIIQVIFFGAFLTILLGGILLYDYSQKLDQIPSFITSVLLVAITLSQALILKKQVEIMSEPIVDVDSLFIGDEIQFWIANVGNYVVKDLKIIVEVEGKSLPAKYTYKCLLFPSLPPQSKYCTYTGSEKDIRIKPRFYLMTNDELGFKQVNILQLMDHLQSLGFSNEKLIVNILIEYSKNGKKEIIEVDKIETTPAQFRLDTGIVVVGPVIYSPQNILRLIQYNLGNKIAKLRTKLGRRSNKKEIIFPDWRQLSFEKI